MLSVASPARACFIFPVFPIWAVATCSISRFLIDCSPSWCCCMTPASLTVRFALLTVWRQAAKHDSEPQQTHVPWDITLKDPSSSRYAFALDFLTEIWHADLVTFQKCKGQRGFERGEKATQTPELQASCLLLSSSNHTHSLLAAAEDAGRHLCTVQRPNHKEHPLCSPVIGVSWPYCASKRGLLLLRISDRTWIGNRCWGLQIIQQGNEAEESRKYTQTTQHSSRSLVILPTLSQNNILELMHRSQAALQYQTQHTVGHNCYTRGKNMYHMLVHHETWIIISFSSLHYCFFHHLSQYAQSS